MNFPADTCVPQWNRSRLSRSRRQNVCSDMFWKNQLDILHTVVPLFASYLPCRLAIERLVIVILVPSRRTSRRLCPKFSVELLNIYRLNFDRCCSPCCWWSGNRQSSFQLLFWRTCPRLSRADCPCTLQSDRDAAIYESGPAEVLSHGAGKH